MCVVVASLVHDLVAPIATIVGVYIGASLAGRRDYRIACGDLRSAFSDLISATHYGTATPAIVKATSQGHEEAILRFQVYVPWWRTKGFKAAYKAYQQRRAVAQADASLNDITPNQYGELVKSIEKLLAYAK